MTTVAKAEVTVYLVQHVADPRRHEPRNVGIIVTDGDVVAHRTLDPAAQRGPERHALQALHEDGTYPAWRDFWERELSPGSSGLNVVLERQGPSFPSQQSVVDIAQRYFEELVMLPVESEEGAPERPVERALRVAGLSDSSHLRRRFKVKAVGPDNLELTFPYAWQNGDLAVAETLLRAGDTAVTGSLWKFEHLPGSVRKVAIVDRYINNRPAGLRAYLNRTATVVHLEEQDAAEQLRQALVP
jgi:hypothetical protein